MEAPANAIDRPYGLIHAPALRGTPCSGLDPGRPNLGYEPPPPGSIAQNSKWREGPSSLFLMAYLRAPFRQARVRTIDRSIGLTASNPTDHTYTF